jgi:hypothetical protein
LLSPGRLTLLLLLRLLLLRLLLLLPQQMLTHPPFVDMLPILLPGCPAHQHHLGLGCIERLTTGLLKDM